MRDTKFKFHADVIGSLLVVLVVLWNLPAQANRYINTRLVASDASLGAAIVDPTLVNAWGIAIRPAGLGGHF
jgi:hypothetical protein